MGYSLRQRIGTLYRALAIKISLLTIVFLVVPVILYRLFQIGDAQQSELLQRAVEQEGNLIASVLRPHLAGFQDESPEALQSSLDEILSHGANVKVLVRPEEAPGTNGFLYVASAPAVSAEYLKEEREKLVRIGVFDKLAPTCDGEVSPSVRFTNPAGRPEVLTSMTPLHIGKNCWVIITSQGTEAVLSSSIGQPIWRTPTVHFAAVVYLLSAVIVAWLFVDIWRNLDRFRTVARKIRMHGAGELSFREMNTIPELTGVADDFDSLVAALKQSKDFIVQAAEENAHAFKAPLAVISQAIEPLKRATPPANLQAWRSLELIERSTMRLDSLVSAARDLEQAAVDVIYPSSRRINLSSYLSQLITAYETTLILDGKRLCFAAERNVYIYATEEAIESIIENLLENAASFTGVGGMVEVTLSAFDGHALLTVCDDGPGVAAENLGRIFERHFSARSATGQEVMAPAAAEQHYGLGLWIARRNAEGLGGKIIARNRDNGGFAVTVSFRSVD